MNNADSIILGYVRVSTDRQDLSVEAQTTAVQRAADYQLGAGSHVDVELFAEPDTSGATPFAEREQGRRLIERVQEGHRVGRKATILVPKLDRFGRDTVDVSLTVTMLEKLGAQILFLDLNVDTRTPTGRFFMQVCAAFAEMELSRIRERIQTALDHKRQHGLLTGTVPYGWNAVDTGEINRKTGKPIRRIEPNPEEQRWILHMATLRAAGLSYNAIAADLNTRNVPTKNGAGAIMKLRSGKRDAETKFTKGKWQFGQIATILNSKTVLHWLKQEHDLKLAA